MKSITTVPADSLVQMATSIVHDGASLLGMSSGGFTILLFGMLLPAAALLSLCAASLALTRRKASRIVAMISLALGYAALSAFVALGAYAVIYGTNWARA